MPFRLEREEGVEVGEGEICTVLRVNACQVLNREGDRTDLIRRERTDIGQLQPLAEGETGGGIDIDEVSTRAGVGIERLRAVEAGADRPLAEGLGDGAVEVEDVTRLVFGIVVVRVDIE